MRLVGLIADRLGLSMAETFYEFGRYWIDFAGASAYGRVLQMAGGDLETFISNLDRMHASIKSNMPLAALPGFEVVESSPAAIHVLYRSQREGLEPFVQGILSAVAERFGETVRVTLRAAGRRRAVRAGAHPGDGLTGMAMDGGLAVTALTLGEAELAELFPAYLRLDLDARIVAAGPSIRSHGGADIVGAPSSSASASSGRRASPTWTA